MPSLRFTSVVLRHWRWLLFAGFLAALASTLYDVVPPRPRWSYDAECMIIHGFLPDGSGLVLEAQSLPLIPGPLMVLDAKTGAVLDRESTWPLANRYLSDDHRFAVGGCHDAEGLSFMDLQSGHAWTWKSPDPTEYPLSYSISPVGDLLVASYAKALRIFETATGKVLSENKLGTTGRFLGFCPDHVVFSENGRGLTFWDRKERCRAGDFAVDGEVEALSPSGRFAVLRNEGELSLWDSREPGQGAFLARIPSNGAFQLFFSPSDRYLLIAVGAEAWHLAIWDLAEKQCLHRIPTWVRVESYHPRSRLKSSRHRFSRDESIWICDLDRGGVEALDVLSGKITWEARNARITDTAPTAFVRIRSLDRVEIIDPQSRELKFSAAWPGDARDYSYDFTSDGRYLAHALPLDNTNGAVATWIEKVLPFVKFSQRRASRVSVVDLEGWSRVCSAKLDCHSLHISGDGRSLVTGRFEERCPGFTQIIECWDIPFARPWNWIIGPPATLAALALAMKWLRFRKLNRTTTANRTVPPLPL